MREDLELAARERAAVAEEVTANLRHDTRNKLGSVRNAAFYIMRKVRQTELWTQDPRVEEFFQLIESELMAIDGLLGEGQMRSPTTEPQASPVRLSECVERALQLLRLPSGVVLKSELGDEAVLKLDALGVALAVRCLLENAIEALPEGGTIWVSTREVTDQVILRVNDSGSGFTEDQLRGALTGVVSTKSGHAGLGLRIVRRVVRRCGGAIKLGTEQGKGGAVELAFPKLHVPKAR